ncbi:methyl-accepting chemotaxis protein [Asticcacaulis endophyticus]|uniref:Methyl-accepting chemotaxis protein n=1 Tax=Asticcacaulis endophyticus TaxID=1395890 RepID=A0A918PSV5_9CAUL|nr:methyl-accepting chemotaxis protein [Asticcacaulis endophyticus]GGZ22132.1 methyl-accepting chemotaxis protein [Asticcacaulis endophyticus]
MLSRLTIRARVIAAFAIVLLSTAALGIFSINRLDSVNKAVDDLGSNWLPTANQLGDMSQTFELLRLRQSQLLTTTGEQQQEIFGNVDKSSKDLDKAYADYLPMIANPDEKVHADKIEAELKTYQANSGQYIAMVKSGELAGAQSFFLGEMQDQGRTFREAIRADRTYQVEAGGKAAADATADGKQASMLILIALGITAAVSVAIGFVMIRTISAPIGKMADTMRTLSGGNTEVKIPNLGEPNEIGNMAAAVEVFKDGMIRTRALEAEAVKAREDSEYQRKQAMRELADQFEGAVGGIVEMVSAAATEMQATAQQLTSSAQESAAQATSVSAAAEEAGTNVTSVAGSAEELGASVAEISRQVDHSLTKAREAVTEADTTMAIVYELSEAATKITGIVDIISAIAQQTNLLALNATIESARAGEAGRGFAVVASEVKTLAQQTAKATEEINQQIAAIQGTTKQAVTAIESISATIREVNDSSTTISAAVEQQGAATNEIVQAVNQASMGTTEVTVNITGVARMAEETGAGASQVLSASSELAEQAEQLRHQVSAFLARVRAA